MYLDKLATIIINARLNDSLYQLGYGTGDRCDIYRVIENVLEIQKQLASANKK